jgi:hypothetical protein
VATRSLKRGAVWRIDFKKKGSFSGEILGSVAFWRFFAPKCLTDHSHQPSQFPQYLQKYRNKLTPKSTPRVECKVIMLLTITRSLASFFFLFVVTERDRDRVAISGVRSFHARLQLDCRFIFHYLVSYPIASLLRLSFDTFIKIFFHFFLLNRLPLCSAERSISVACHRSCVCGKLSVRSLLLICTGE